MKTIIKNTITCGQNDLKNMSITQNGTVAVHTAEGVALPHVMMDNVRMEMGGGEIIVSKEIKANPFCRRRTNPAPHRNSRHRPHRPAAGQERHRHHHHSRHLQGCHRRQSRRGRGQKDHRGRHDTHRA